MQRFPDPSDNCSCAAPTVPTDDCQAQGATNDMNQTTAMTPSWGAQPILTTSRQTVRLLVLVEGGYDVSFLKRISSMLHARDRQIPDLRALEQDGTIVFVPVGGSNLCHWLQLSH